MDQSGLEQLVDGLDALVGTQLGVVPEQLPQVPGNGQADVSIHIDLGDAQLGNFLQLILGDAVGVGDGAAQSVDFLDDVLRHSGRTMGDQRAEDALMTQALLGGDGDGAGDGTTGGGSGTTGTEGSGTTGDQGTSGGNTDGEDGSGDNVNF